MNKLLIYRAVGLVAVVAVSVVAFLFGKQFPIVNVAASGVCWYVGKLVGVPTAEVVKTALQAMQPDQAAAVTIDALQAMPPLQAETVSRTLLASIPPVSGAIPIAPVVQLVNTDAPSNPPQS